MTTLREAAQQALEALEAINLGYLADVEAALRAALAQEQAEPVAWRITDGEGGWEYRTDLPEDWSIQWSARHGRKYEPLYTTPPQRVPLTDEEIDRIRAAEREECAKRLEAIGCDHCAANIRARSKA